ncbi:hypothetical protein [Novosphingobium soli]|uniref:Uncharacterized protein n=1 Tax=Novosphingobium soli TaxID=574956 RepID=A0ABV6CZA0_9SPHN
MRRIKIFLHWLLRHAVLYLALVLAFAVAPLVAQAWRSAAQEEATWRGLAGIEAQLHADSAALARRFDAATAGLEARGTAEIDTRLRRSRAALAGEKAGLEEGRGPLALYREGPAVLLTNQRRRLRIVLLEREVRTLEAARALADRRDAETRHREAAARHRQAQDRCTAATGRLRALEREWSYRWRSWVESAAHKALAEEARQRCAERDAARAAVEAIGYVEGSRQQAAAAYAASRRDVAAALDTTLAALGRERREAEIRWQGTAAQKLRLWAREWQLGSLLTKALWALAAILAVPYAIRMLFWFVLAPLAERRPAIRLRVPGPPGEPEGAGGIQLIAPGAPSTTSVAVRLGAGEELLVRQSYLQTSSHAGAKATQWLLDWRHPLASLVSGLTFLTRMRGEGELTTVSAVRDPFAEVAVLALPEGASCVLQPRALAAVVQPVGRPLRITAHWRLGSLNAWLTLQLRYLVFHGPGRLVLKGARGVRVERAERGRVFGQAQLVGFSADLSYSVTRTETFWPYLLGIEPLFKDKVEAGEGVLVIEEAPLAGVATGRAGHGLEGAFDVMTKALGI